MVMTAAAVATGAAQRTGPRVAVIGAGAFGGWTALELVRRGARVTLIDAWGPGNVRASSGGETRVIRAVYGTRPIYTRMAQRAFELWRAHDQKFERRFFHKTGGLWMFGADASFGKASADALAAAKLPFEWLTAADLAKRFPQISNAGITTALWEPEAGYLLARRACEHVAERVVAEGGAYRQGAVRSPVRADGGRLGSVTLDDGSAVEADAFVFACGPWLGTLFPDVIGEFVKPTRQEVYYFGTPAGDRRFEDGQMPVWIDFGDRLLYGIPGNTQRGFKLADDTSGPAFDPTNGSRDLAAAGVEWARKYLAARFPALANAPFLGGEVCQYEASPDSHFIVDAHPGAPNVWLVGGGSGHGFKMGPAMGEIVAGAVLGASKPDPTFQIARFRRSTGPLAEKWS